MRMLYARMQGKIYRVSDQPLKGIWDFGAHETSKEWDYWKESERKLAKDESFFIKASFEDLKDYNLVICDDTPHINMLSKGILKKIQKIKESKAVLFVRMEEEGKIKLYFQVIRQCSFIKKKFISFSNMAHIEDKPIILIENRTDVYWSQETGKFYFKNIEDLERVLPHFFENKVQDIKQGLQAIKEDASYRYLHLELDLKEIKSTIPRTKLARIKHLLQEERLEIFKENGDPRKRNDYLKYAQKYKPRMVKNEKLMICKASDLDSLCKIIDENYYTTEIGGEQRVANVSEKNSLKD
ncbi:hypothetical protein [Helicobacter salomonis]|uniref:hypothetical protein n=1 Tax=Helicobacter salomonis TaxID=56878 RepID=UPI000CF13B71|nr:hypothetical protein [Helicobacter salomonis]